MQIEFLDWPAVATIIGIASTIGAYWLQNRREEREEKALIKRLDDFEKKLDKQDKLVGVHDKLLVDAGKEASRQNELTNALVERTDAQDELVDAQKETADELAKRLDDHLQSPEGPPASTVSTQATRTRGRLDALIKAVLFTVEKLEHAESGRVDDSCVHLDLRRSIVMLELLRDENEDSQPGGADG